MSGCLSGHLVAILCQYQGGGLLGGAVCPCVANSMAWADSVLPDPVEVLPAKMEVDAGFALPLLLSLPEASGPGMLPYLSPALLLSAAPRLLPAALAALVQLRSSGRPQLLLRPAGGPGGLPASPSRVLVSYGQLE
jgi:hypothetical protein